MLDPDANYEKVYSLDYKEKKEEEKEVPRGYEDWKEYRFYNGDDEFMRFHKRTRRNMHDVVQELLQSSN